MADDVAAAMVATMDDDELSAHVAGLRARLDGTRQGDEGRSPLLTAFGRACAELNARGLPDAGEPGE